jgi:hypothetical protein
MGAGSNDRQLSLFFASELPLAVKVKDTNDLSMGVQVGAELPEGLSMWNA